MRVLVVTAMYPTPANPAYGSFIKTQVDTLAEMGLAMEVFVLEGSSRKWAYARSVPRLRRRVAKGDVDLLHANYVYAGLVARMQSRVPVVVTYNGSDLLGPVARTDGGHSRLGDLSVAASKVLARMVDASIVPSEEMAERIATGRNVHVLPHGMDMDVFAPTDRAAARATLGLDADTPYLLFAARPDNHVKNFPLARAATELLRSEYADVKLITVHDEPQARLALYMSACDALVFPSYQEGSPNVVKQAMACNLPIVASDVGDVRSLIGGTVGCHVCPLDAESFRDSLGEVLRERRRTDGRSAVRGLDRRVVAVKVAALYDEVLVKARARRSGRTAGTGAAQPEDAERT